MNQLIIETKTTSATPFQSRTPSESTAGYFKSTLSPIRGNNQQVIIDDGDQCSFSFPTTSYHNKVTSTPEKYKRTDISNIKKKEPNYAQMHMEEDEIENIFPEKMKMENDKKLPLRKRKPKRESELIASKTILSGKRVCR